MWFLKTPPRRQKSLPMKAGRSKQKYLSEISRQSQCQPRGDHYRRLQHQCCSEASRSRSQWFRALVEVPSFVCNRCDLHGSIDHHKGRQHGIEVSIDEASGFAHWVGLAGFSIVSKSSMDRFVPGYPQAVLRHRWL